MQIGKFVTEADRTEWSWADERSDGNLVARVQAIFGGVE